MNQPPTSFAHQIERQASSLCSNLVLPDLNSSNFSFRLSRFPIKGTETVLDVHSSGKRIFITVSRFLNSLRSNINQFGVNNKDTYKPQPIEISISECSPSEPLIREILNNEIFNLGNNLTKNINNDHYFLFFTDSRNCIATGISNPHDFGDEQWVRLINRSYGAELLPPRRNEISLVI